MSDRVWELQNLQRLLEQCFLGKTERSEIFVLMWISGLYALQFQGLYPLVPISEEERLAFKKQYARTGKIPTVLEDS